MPVFDAEMWATRFELAVMIEENHTIRRNGVNLGTVSNNSESAIPWMVHLEPGPS
jgi:hypothetical protein